MLAAIPFAVWVPSAGPAATSTAADPPLAFEVFYGDEHSDESAIFRANTDGSHARQLVRSVDGVGAPAWSPDGRRIAYETSLGIKVMDADGRHRRTMVKDGYMPRWSPDGRQLAYLRSGGTLGIVDVATGRIRRRLDLRPLRALKLDWSRKGRIAFSQGGLGDNGEIYVIGSNGKGLRKLIAAPSGVYLDQPRWSPDGRRLLYSWHRNVTTFLYLARADGSHRQRLIRTQADARGSWSWDGSRIAYGVIDIRLLNLRTRGLRKLPTCRRYNCYELDWSHGR